MNVPDLDERGEFAWEIITFAAARGFKVTAGNLKYWHEQGAIPAPRSVQHPRKGRTGLYPSGTGEQVIALRIFLDQKLDIAEATWRLWLDGYPVRKDRGRGRFEGAAAWLDEARVGILGPAFESNGQALSDAVLDPLEAQRRSYDPRFRLFRKTVGASRLPTLLFWLLGVARGQPIPRPKAYSRSAEAIELRFDHGVIVQGLGLQRIDKDMALGIQPIPADNLFSNLNVIANRMKSTIFSEELARVSDSAIRDAAREIHNVEITSKAIYSAFSSFFGRHAFGRELISKLLDRHNDNDRIMIIMLWSIFRGDFSAKPIEPEKLDPSLVDQIIRERSAAQEMLKANPALAAIWTPAAYREALTQSRNGEEFSNKMRFLVIGKLLEVLKLRAQQLEQLNATAEE